MNAWLPQASYPCGNFSDTSSLKSPGTKGSIGHAFTVCIHTENQNQMSFYPFVLHEISVLIELILGHLRYLLTDVPPQPNSPPDNVFSLDRQAPPPERERAIKLCKKKKKQGVRKSCPFLSSHLFPSTVLNLEKGPQLRREIPPNPMSCPMKRGRKTR